MRRSQLALRTPHRRGFLTYVFVFDLLVLVRFVVVEILVVGIEIEIALAARRADFVDVTFPPRIPDLVVTLRALLV
jgi:hypothetical protein